MSQAKNTRSRINLEGNIRNYLLETSTMPDEIEHDEPNDIQSLLTIMTKTLTAVTQSQTANGSNKNQHKLEECPIKRKTSSLEAWIGEISLWDESNTGDYDGLNAKKYLKFVDSIRKSEDCTDLQNLVEVEFVENVSFDKKSGTVIQKMLEKIKEKLGQTDLEKCSEVNQGNEKQFNCK